jgi:hypothetical protein
MTTGNKYSDALEEWAKENGLPFTKYSTEISYVKLQSDKFSKKNEIHRNELWLLSSPNGFLLKGFNEKGEFKEIDEFMDISEALDAAGCGHLKTPYKDPRTCKDNKDTQLNHLVRF